MLTLVTCCLVALLDQITKVLVRSAIPLGHRIPIVPCLFDLCHVQNTGAAWGILQGRSTWLVAVSFVMLFLIVIFRRHFIRDPAGYRFSIGLMMGGIVGNLIDRIRLGYVVDFLDFYWGAHHFPAFNVADSSICVGVCLYILTQILEACGKKSGGVPSTGAT